MAQYMKIISTVIMMRMYSKYPTDINKYECRTGSFEGFFVCSVDSVNLINSTKMIEKIEMEVIIKREHKAQ
jgi:hypothetical protein